MTRRILALLAFAAPLFSQTAVPGGVYSTDQTWTLAGSPYILDGPVRFYGNANPRLTIEAGVEVRFLGGARLEIGHSFNVEGDAYRGQLTAVGTALQPIRFLSSGPGQTWNGLRFYNATDFNGASSQLEYAEFSGADTPVQLYRTGLPELRNLSILDATQEGVRLEQCVPAPVLENVSVTGSVGHGLVLAGSSLPAVSGISLAGNGDDRVRYTGTVETDVTLDLAAFPLPVVFGGTTYVRGAANPRLTLPAGTELRFLGGARMEIAHGFNVEGDAYRGQLTAVGTVPSPVRFLADDPLQPWQGLLFYNASDFNGASSQLEHAEFSGADWPLRLYRTASPALRDLAIAGAGHDGLRLEQCVPAPLLENVTATGSGGHGLTLAGSALPAVSGVSLSGNGDDRVLYTGEIETDVTLDLAAFPLPVVFGGTTYVRGAANPRLTLPAGTELRFLGGARMEIAHGFNVEGDAYRGQLTAVGTVPSPVRFLADDPLQPWQGLLFYNASDFNGASSQLEHAEFSGADWPLRLYRTASPALRDLAIAGAGHDGLRLEQCVPAPLLENVTATGSGGHGLTLAGSALPAVSGVSLSGNGDDRVLYTGEIETDVTLDLAAFPLPVVFGGTTYVRGAANPRLTLPAGTELRFLGGARMEIAHGFNVEGDAYRGQLTAVGTVPSPVRFLADDPLQPWQGLLFYNASDFNGASSQLEHAEFSGADWPLRLYRTASPALRDLAIAGAGHDGLRLEQCVPAPLLENVTATGSGGHGLTLAGSALPAVSGVSLSGNGDDRVLYTGEIETDVTLDLAAFPLPVVFGGTTYVRGAANPRLTLPAGTELRFLGGGRMEIAHGFNVEGDAYRGQLTAVGTAPSPVRFVADDGAQPWQGLVFYNASDWNGASCQLEHASIEGASEALTLNRTDSPDLRDVVLRGATDAALSLIDSRPAVERCWFLESGTGVYLANADTTMIGDSPALACTFLGNRDWDLYNDGAGDVLARHNGWCTPEGEALADRVYDEFDNPSKGLVTYNPTGAVGLLRVAAQWRASTEELRLEWCPLIGALSYTVYGADSGWPDPATATAVATVTDTWLDIPLAELPTRQFYTVVADVSGAALGRGRSGCR